MVFGYHMKENDCGIGWIVETILFSVKRKLGENVVGRPTRNMIAELIRRFRAHGAPCKYAATAR